MPYCAVLQCKNDSRRINLKNGGISYHRFPKDPSVEENWIDATGRVNWMPTKTSTICSEHFLDEDFLISQKGFKYIKPKALPTLKIVKYLKQQEIWNDRKCSKIRNEFGYNDLIQSKKRRCREDSVDEGKYISTLHNQHEMISMEPLQPHIVDIVIKKERETMEDMVNTNVAMCSTSPQTVNFALKSENKSIDCIEATNMTSCSTTMTEKLKGQLRFCRNKIKKQALKIKRLQTSNRRLKTKITNINEIISKLENRRID